MMVHNVLIKTLIKIKCLGKKGLSSFGVSFLIFLILCTVGDDSTVL